MGERFHDEMLQALAGDDVALERGGVVLLEALSFRVAAGSALILTGPNGVGKTTLLRACAGLLPLAAGQIAIEGGDPELGVGEQAHYVGHLNALKPALSVRENLAFWGAYLGAGSRGGVAASVDAGIDRFQLAALADIPVSYLSAGQRRRCALARVLVAPRPVWLLDEPTVALDTAMRDLFIGIVNAHLEAGGLVVAATHLPLPFRDVTSLPLGVAGEVGG